MRALERILLLLLISIPASSAVPIAMATESTDTLIARGRHFSMDVRTGYYTASFDGIALGDVPGTFTQYEEGYFENMIQGYGWMKIVLTTENGKVLHIELGTRDNPYVWKLVSGSWFTFHRTEMTGPVYVDGRNICMYHTVSIAFGKSFIMEDFPVG